MSSTANGDDVDWHRFTYYVVTLMLPAALGVAGCILLILGIHEAGRVGLQSALPPVIIGLALIIIAIATASFLVWNERKQYREMMSGADLHNG